MDFDTLRRFLIEANRAGYASGEARQWINEADRSTSIVYQSGAWKMHDNFFGGEPYGGRLVVFYEDRPVWMMVYYGWSEAEDIGPIYGFLREALKEMPERNPYRGPEKFVDGKMTYTNQWHGHIGWFTGEETISFDGKEVYRGTYAGGLVDQRAGI